MEVKDFIEQNHENLLRLDRIGVKTINAAIDYLSIWHEYERHHWIEREAERKQVVANRCKVAVRTVAYAVSLMKRKL